VEGVVTSESLIADRWARMSDRLDGEMSEADLIALHKIFCTGAMAAVEALMLKIRPGMEIAEMVKAVDDVARAVRAMTDALLGTGPE